MDSEVNKNWFYHKEYNGKEEGCGDLIVNLFRFFKTVNSGEMVCVTAHDMGAKYDIPAWCRSTDKEILESEPPYFLIKKN